MPRLLINPGTAQEWEIQLKPGVNTLGRSPDCDFQIEHGSVSGTHCRITVEDGVIKLHDLGSTNGTFLERAPVHEASLHSGQRLQLGSVEVQFLNDSPGTAGTSQAPAVPGGIRLATPVIPAAQPAVPTCATLRVAAPTTPPAEPPPPPPAAYLPDEYDASLTGPAMCKYHPKTIARWLCLQCQLNFCDLCVASRPGGAHSGKYCRRCSGECVGLNVQLVSPTTHRQSFFTMIPGAFAYPLKGTGIVFLICGAIGFAFLDFLRGYGGIFAIGLNVIYGGYLFAFMQRVIQTAAQGSDETASWPDVTEFYQDIIQPFFQMLAVGVFCFGPAIALSIWAIVNGSGTAGPNPALGIGIIVAAIGGAVYYPMALLAVAMFDSVMAVSPHVVVPAILRVPLEYVCVLVVTGVLVVAYGVQTFLVALVPIPIVPELIASLVWLYFLIVIMRLLGLMHFAKRDRLAWFSH